MCLHASLDQFAFWFGSSSAWVHQSNFLTPAAVWQVKVTWCSIKLASSQWILRSYECLQDLQKIYHDVDVASLISVDAWPCTYGKSFRNAKEKCRQCDLTTDSIHQLHWPHYGTFESSLKWPTSVFQVRLNPSSLLSVSHP